MFLFRSDAGCGDELNDRHLFSLSLTQIGLCSYLGVLSSGR